MSEKQNVEGLQSLVLLAGIYEGVLPFVSKAFGWHPFLAFPVRLDAPLWWMVSAAVIVVSAVLLVLLDGAKVDLRKHDT